MSIRTRLIALCLFVSLLPAIPVSFLVRGLIERSINVGLSEDVSEALGGGIEVSRKYISLIRSQFERDIAKIINESTASRTYKISSERMGYLHSTGVKGTSTKGAQDSLEIARLVAKSGGIDGFFTLSSSQQFDEWPSDTVLKKELSLHLSKITDMVSSGNSIRLKLRTPTAKSLRNVRFLETEKHDLQIALWQSPEDKQIVFFKMTEPDFLKSANKIIHGNQTFAQLRLSQKWLSESFFYPFILVYAVILAISLLTAFLLAERLSAPIRKLEKATSAVANGKWDIRISGKAGGEIGKLIDGFNRMIGKLKEQNRRIIDMEKMVAWRDVARHLAHEIKNPILPIRLTIQEIRDQYKGTDENYRELLDESVRVVEDELKSLQNLVKEFSLLAKMPALSPAKGSMEKLVRDVVKLYPQVEAEVVVDPSLKEFLFDQDKMRQVLVNLITNSIEAVPENTKVKIRIELSITARDEFVMTYTDNGPGIPADIADRVFDPYFSTRNKGTGLGLAIVKNIVMLHGGTIELENTTESSGARFRITIPINRSRVEVDGESQAAGSSNNDDKTHGEGESGNMV